METVITTAISSSTAQITDVLTTTLPVVLAFFGSLVALGIALRLFKKYVGRKA